MANAISALQVSPEYAQILTSWRKALCKFNQLVAALADMSKATEVRPGDADTLIRRDFVKHCLGHLAEPDTDYNGSVERD